MFFVVSISVTPTCGASAADSTAVNVQTDLYPVQIDILCKDGYIETLSAETILGFSYNGVAVTSGNSATECVFDVSA